MNVPNKVVLHCSATKDFGESDPLFDHYGIEQITEWHMARGFKTVGYHYVIKRGGLIQVGRPESEIGAHCIGQNEQSIGICYVGTYDPTLQQLASLDYLFKSLKDRYGFGPGQWHPHNEFANKVCPGVDINVIRTRFANLTSVL